SLRRRRGCRTASASGGRPRWSSSPTASSSATASYAGTASGLEVHREDLIGPEGTREALDLVLHVGVHEPLEVTHERLGAAVELLLEAIDELLLEDPAADPGAVGAAERHLPVLGAGLGPLHGVHQVRRAARADVEPLDPIAGRSGLRRD